MEPLPRIVGVDYGAQRVGLAISDPFRLYAQSIGACSGDEALRKLARLNEDPGFDTIVVGWPLTLSGEEGASAAVARSFARRLSRRFPGKNVVMQDERYSSVRARRLLHRAAVRKKARRDKKRVDAAAAAVILQDYIDETQGDASRPAP